MRTTALYYPYFVPQDDAWLASALLWWEEVFLIWPRGIQTSSEVVLELMEAQAIRTVDPSDDVMAYAPEFVETVLKPHLGSLGETAPDMSEAIYLHSAKLGPLTSCLDSVETSIGRRYSIASDEYVTLDKAIEIPYMSFLARKLSANPTRMWPASPADVVSDDSLYLQYFGGFEALPGNGLTKARAEADQAVLMTLKNAALGVADFNSRQVEELLRFRDDHRGERERYRRHVASTIASLKLAGAVRGDEASDLVQDASCELTRGLGDLEKQIRGTRLRAKLADLGVVLLGALTFPASPPMSVATTVIGLASSEAVAEHQARDTKAQSPYTYLYQAKRSFPEGRRITRLGRSLWRRPSR